MTTPDENGWMPIETLTKAHDWTRVLVAGWSPAKGRVEGYWWAEEDNVVDGRPFTHRDARLWQLFPSRPTDPPVS